MNFFTRMSALSAFALAALSPAAKAADYLRVHVPFAFVVAGEKFAPGEYVIKESEGGVISVQGAGRGAMVLSTPASPANESAGSSLRFTNAGQQLHLTTVEQQGVDARYIPVRTVEQRSVTLSSR